uniref:Fatty acid hydroxylase domain-containing protein n=1 Tax=viral metagenome TaxID=1070528 RepID=A0A6C0LB91_9ZZZZ
MIHLLTKNTLPHLICHQFIPGFTFLVLGILLTYKTISPIRTALSIILIFLYSYFIHKLFHHLPKPINIHMFIHHNHKNENNSFVKYTNLFIECLMNIFFFVLFYYIQQGLSNHFVPNIIIFYYGFVYTTIHIINYSIFHCSKAHVIHHKTGANINKTCNYGPDVLDHLFKTNYDEKIENYNHILLNIIFAFFASYYVFKPTIV